MPLPERCRKTCFRSGIAREWLSQYSITFSLMPSSILSLYASLHIRAQQEASSSSSIFTLNLMYLCSFFLETWSSFDIVATIRFIEVLHAKIAVVISLREKLISVFLDFPNADSAVVTFYVTFSHAFLFLTYFKPKKIVARFNFCVLSIHVGFELV